MPPSSYSDIRTPSLECVCGSKGTRGQCGPKRGQSAWLWTGIPFNFGGTFSMEIDSPSVFFTKQICQHSSQCFILAFSSNSTNSLKNIEIVIVIAICSQRTKATAGWHYLDFFAMALSSKIIIMFQMHYNMVNEIFTMQIIISGVIQTFILVDWED